MVSGRKFVRVAVGGESALSNSQTAINIWVSPQELATIKRLESLFHKVGRSGQHGSHVSTLNVMEFEEVQP